MAFETTKENIQKSTNSNQGLFYSCENYISLFILERRIIYLILKNLQKTSPTVCLPFFFIFKYIT